MRIAKKYVTNVALRDKLIQLGYRVHAQVAILHIKTPCFAAKAQNNYNCIYRGNVDLQAATVRKLIKTTMKYFSKVVETLQQIINCVGYTQEGLDITRHIILYSDTGVENGNRVPFLRYTDDGICGKLMDSTKSFKYFPYTQFVQPVQQLCSHLTKLLQLTHQRKPSMEQIHEFWKHGYTFRDVQSLRRMVVMFFRICPVDRYVHNMGVEMVDTAVLNYQPFIAPRCLHTQPPGWHASICSTHVDEMVGASGSVGEVGYPVDEMVGASGSVGEVGDETEADYVDWLALHAIIDGTLDPMRELDSIYPMCAQDPTDPMCEPDPNFPMCAQDPTDLIYPTYALYPTDLICPTYAQDPMYALDSMDTMDTMWERDIMDY